MSTKDGELVRPSRLAYGRSYTTRTLQYSPPTLELAMLNSIGRASAIITLVCAALLATTPAAGAADSIRPCTNEEYDATCGAASNSGYFDSWQNLWFCPSSYTCMWDEEENEPAGFVNYDSQETPCPTQLPCL
jgi:hypothetical protein